MKYIKLLFFILLQSYILSGCSSSSQTEKLTVTGLYFDTVIQIDAWGTDSDTLNSCLDLCEYYENKFSNTIEDSEITRINNANGQAINVSDETIDILKKGIEYGELTNGKFDITISSVSNLWKFTDNEEGILPDEKLISEALKHVGYKNIIIEGNMVKLNDPDTKIDLGGIAKGYIADRIKEYLLENDVTYALINLGGNSLAVGTKPDGTDFRIGIQKPFAEQGTVCTVVEVKNQSVVSSGIYERYFEKDDIIYHHLLDTETGYPVQNDLLQVTIISDNSVDGDALSTSCYVLGLDEGRKLIKKLDGITAIFITSDYEMHYVE